MYEVRDEQSLNSLAWPGFLSRAGRCRGYVWSNFVLTVVEQCLLLRVSCLTLRVSIWTVGPRAKEQRSGKAIVPDASLASHSNELKQQNVPSACLLCCWNSKNFLSILHNRWFLLQGNMVLWSEINPWFLEICFMSVTLTFSSDCAFLLVSMDHNPTWDMLQQGWCF